MSASEVTDFERSFRYFAIWLHGQVFSKLLLGLFFQCQKSDWTYLKKKNNLKIVSSHQGRTKRRWRHAWMGVCVCVRACGSARACTCVSVDLSKGKQSLPTRLHPWPHLVSRVSCRQFFWHLLKPQTMVWLPRWAERWPTDLGFGGICVSRPLWAGRWKDCRLSVS